MTLLEELHQHNIVMSNGNTNPNTRVILQKTPLLQQKVNIFTSKLPSDARLRERIYCIVNNITTRPICKCCSNPVNARNSGKIVYPQYCSKKCAYLSEDRNKKKKNTMIERYGVEYTAQSEDLKSKMNVTCIERYGVDNPFKSDVFQDKAKATRVEKFGVENVLDNFEIKQKHQQQVHKSRYVDKNVPLKLDCELWLTSQHHNKQKSLQKIALDLGLKDRTSVSRKLKQYNIDIKRFCRSTGEQEMGGFLDTLNMYYIANTRIVICPYELDIYIPSHNLAIEYCGLYWHADIHNRMNNKYHKNKYDMCKNQNIQLLTIFEDEWVNNRIQVENKIKTLLHVSDKERVFARNTDVVVVLNDDKQLFLNKNHIQGNGPGSVSYGLIYEDSLVAVMSFIKQSNNRFVLNRYATSHQVVGGFSKLLKYFQRNNKWNEIVSFADQRWSNGNLYKTTGWTLDKIIPPDYYYSPDGVNRFHKFNYRRKYLPNKLKHFDPELSERENCDNNGILRIWDCGKLRYVLKNT